MSQQYWWFSLLANWKVKKKNPPNFSKDCTICTLKFPLLLISSFISLWSDKKEEIISIFVLLKSCFRWEMCLTKESSKAFWKNMLWTNTVQTLRRTLPTPPCEDDGPRSLHMWSKCLPWVTYIPALRLNDKGITGIKKFLHSVTCTGGWQEERRRKKGRELLYNWALIYQYFKQFTIEFEISGLKKSQLPNSLPNFFFLIYYQVYEK